MVNCLREFAMITRQNEEEFGDLKDLIKVIPENCVGCNACIRSCPTNEANITTMKPDGSFVTVVNPDKCINCGECIRTCKHGARDYIDDTYEFMANIKKTPMALLVTPAIKSVFPTTWQSILVWFKQHGVKLYDVSFGADICSWAHLRAIEKGLVGNIITQPCAAIVNYVQIYKPNLIQFLSPVHSPISCESIYLRKVLKLDCQFAVLSPCIAKKSEFDTIGIIDYNVTFKKLKEYFEKVGITHKPNSALDFEFDFDDQQGLVGSIYPRPGGLRDNLWLHNPDLNITTSEGVHKVYPEIDMYGEMPDFKHPEVFDVLSCEFGCNTGPATGTEQTIFDIMATMRDVEKFSKKKRKTGLFNAGADKQYKKFDDTLNLEDYMRKYAVSDAYSSVVKVSMLDDVFKSMGKVTEAQRHFDCHACGYKSCVEMATAIYRGNNVPDNCIVHAKAMLKEQHDKLISDHDKLTKLVVKANEISEKLLKDIEKIGGDIKTINGVNLKTGEKSQKVHGLLEKIIMFCSTTPEMDRASVQQLIDILEIVAVAFKALDSNVTETNERSNSITESIAQVDKLIDDLNQILNETSNVSH